jgi:hypothetical protein
MDANGDFLALGFPILEHRKVSFRAFSNYLTCLGQCATVQGPHYKYTLCVFFLRLLILNSHPIGWMRLSLSPETPDVNVIKV